MNYRALTTITIILVALCVLGIIWQPFGSWWQWLTTAGVLTFVAAGFSSAADWEQEK